MSPLIATCQSCGQDPFPQLQLRCEELRKMRQRHSDNYKIHDADLYSLRNSPLDLAKYVETMEIQLRIAREALATALALAAPIRRLPDEILAGIFDQFAYFNVTDRRRSQTELSKISVVCRRWHYVITSTASFWTAVDLPSFKSTPDSKYLHFLSAQLRRTAKSPVTVTGLNISHFQHAHDTDLLLEDGNPLLSCLKPYYGHLTKLGLNISACSAGIFEFHFHMPALKRLDLRLVGSTYAPEPINLVLPDHHFPNLCHVKLLLDCGVSNISLPWPQLLTFDISSPQLGPNNGPPPYNPFVIFPRLTNVEQLNVIYDAPSDPPDSEHSTIVLPHLRSFTLRKSCYQYRLSSLPWHLDAPELKSLKLEGFVWVNSALLAGHFPSLLSLELTWTASQLKTFQPILLIYALHALTKVEEFNCTIHGDSGLLALILEELGKSGNDLFPLLRSLDLKCALVETLDALEDFVRARISPIDVAADRRKPLRTVRIGRFDDCRHEVTLVVPRNYNDMTTTLEMKGIFTEFTLYELNALRCINGL